MTSARPNLDAFTAGVPTAVDVADIERQLSAMWQRAADAPGQPVTRASMGTLIVVCDHEDALSGATDIARDLTAHHPCRVLAILCHEERNPPSLHASITAHCHIGAGGGKQVCSEQITVRATGSAIAQLPPVIESLLESDLPVTTWWNCPWTQAGALRDRLLAVSHRCCFDPSGGASDAVVPAALQTILRAHPRVAFHDLNWVRLAFWRTLTAEVFDNPAAAEELPRLEAAEIRHGTAPGAAWRAQLYAAWLAHRLGRALAVTFQQENLPDAGLLAITLHSAHGRFELCSLPRDQAARAVVHLAQFCELPRQRALWPTDPVSLLRRALDDPRPSTTYRQIVDSLCR